MKKRSITVKLPSGKTATVAGPTTATTPAAVAQDHCPNASDGGCLGQPVFPDKRLYGVAGEFCTPLPQCLVSMGLPCRVFARILEGNTTVHRVADVAASYTWQIAGTWIDRARKMIEKDPIGMAVYLDHPFCGVGPVFPRDGLKKRLQAKALASGEFRPPPVEIRSFGEVWPLTAKRLAHKTRVALGFLLDEIEAQEQRGERRPDDRSERHCECGALLEPGKRLCPDCRKAHRASSRRRARQQAA